MAKQDFYDILGVSKSADADELKRAYRKLAMQFHPDRNPGDTSAEHKFKDINEAYDVLKDDQKRAAYDRFGHAAFENGSRGPGDFAAGFPAASPTSSRRCSARWAAAAPRPARAAAATCATISKSRSKTPFAASRRRSASPPSPIATPAREWRRTRHPPVQLPHLPRSRQGAGAAGLLHDRAHLPDLPGLGQTIDKPCKACGGQGRTRREKTLSVNIPPGVEDGTRIRLAGEGEAGPHGAAAGDLYIFVSITQHQIFQRDGANIFCRVPIPITTAALGGAIEVPTVEGNRTRVTVPPGTQSGHQFRLRGKGMTVLRSNLRGDMYIHAIVETPVNLTKRQQELLREFEKEGENRKTNPKAKASSPASRNSSRICGSRCRAYSAATTRSRREGAGKAVAARLPLARTAPSAARISSSFTGCSTLWPNKFLT